MALDGSYQDIQQLIAVLEQVLAAYRPLPAFSTADANRVVRVDPTGTAFLLSDYTAAGIGAVPTARALSTAADSGIAGGGDLSADRALALALGGLTLENGIALADRLPFWDTSATANRGIALPEFWRSISLLPAIATPAAGNKLLAYDGTAAGTLDYSLIASALRSAVLTVYTTSAVAASGHPIHAGLIAALVIATGGGAGGGRAVASAPTSAAGGGGGAGATALALYTRAQLVAAANAQGNIDINIGAGGGSASAASGVGGSGGSTILGSLLGGILTAPGGVGGVSAGPGASAIGGLGGTLPTSGQGRYPGGGGGYGLATAPFVGGEGGSSFWGPGGPAPNAATTPLVIAGIAGLAPGSGGSGAVSRNLATAAAGGLGKAGQMLILEWRTS